MIGECDYAIVGGGAAGLVLADRLSADPRVRVVVIEAGRRRRSPLLSVPAGETLLLGNPRYDWRFRTQPDGTLEGRQLAVPRGRLLGGSTAINGMIFVRGQRDDFDGWARAGCEGWGWDDVLPFFRALEDWQGGEETARGVGGPIRVELPRHREPLAEIFLKAAGEAGFALNPDYNSGDLEGFAPAQITARSGRRSCVLDGHLAEAAGRENLRILCDAEATGLWFDKERCLGVALTRGGETTMLRARAETVLCAGTIGSPKLLELSGIGDPAVLARAGIAPRHALPGVGTGFRDHLAARLRWRVRPPPGTRHLTFNERTRGFALLREILRYGVSRTGVLAQPIAVAVGFARSTPGEPVPDLQFHFAPASYPVSGKSRRLDRQPGMTIGVYPMRPDAEGTVHVQGPDPSLPPAIATAFLSCAADRRRLLAGIAMARRIVASPAFDACRGEELVPGPGVIGEEALLAHLRESADTSFHPVGTCRMGTGANAVVDPRLRVHGLAGLRVVDASIMPTHVSGNTQAAAMMIAEKGAAMIRADAESPAAVAPWVSPAPARPGDLVVAAGDPLAADVVALLAASEELASALYPQESVHLLPRAALADDHVRFLVARDGLGRALGCGALVLEGGGFGELKRMFVAAHARRRGVGRALLAGLDAEAAAHGLHTLRLETGVAQPEALALYRAAGFGACPPFGAYRPDPLSVFLTRPLDPQPQRSVRHA